MRILLESDSWLCRDSVWWSFVVCVSCHWVAWNWMDMKCTVTQTRTIECAFCVPPLHARVVRQFRQDLCVHLPAMVMVTWAVVMYAVTQHCDWVYLVRMATVCDLASHLALPVHGVHNLVTHCDCHASGVHDPPHSLLPMSWDQSCLLLVSCFSLYFHKINFLTSNYCPFVSFPPTFELIPASKF